MRIISSTPLQHRSAQTPDSDTSLLDTSEGMSIGKTDSDESNRVCTPSRHEEKVSEVLDSLLLCTPVKEHASLQKARVLIAANELYESDESYRKRLNSLPERKSGEIKISTFCKKRSLSTSFEGVDFTQWLSDDSIKDELHSEEKCVGGVTTISEHLWMVSKVYTTLLQTLQTILL